MAPCRSELAVSVKPIRSEPIFQSVSREVCGTIHSHYAKSVPFTVQFVILGAIAGIQRHALCRLFSAVDPTQFDPNETGTDSV